MKTVTFTRLDDGATALIFDDGESRWSKIHNSVELAGAEALSMGMLSPGFQPAEMETFRGRVHSWTFLVPEFLQLTPDNLRASGFNEFLI